VNVERAISDRNRGENHRLISNVPTISPPQPKIQADSRTRYGAKAIGLREKICNSDSADFLPVDHNRDILTKPIVHPQPIPSGRIWIGVNFNLVVAQIDNPVDGNTRAAIALEFLAPVVVQATVRDLHDQAAICGRRIARRVVLP
jgi:hypothetical protein